MNALNNMQSVTPIQDEMSWLRKELQQSEIQRSEAAAIYEKSKNQLQARIEELEAELSDCLISASLVAADYSADAILDRAAGHMRDRAKTYDAASGERSMGKVAAIVRVLYAEQLGRGEFSEEMAWGLQVVLKLVRSSQGGYRADNYEDMAAYAALMGESAGREATGA